MAIAKKNSNMTAQFVMTCFVLVLSSYLTFLNESKFSTIHKQNILLNQLQKFHVIQHFGSFHFVFQFFCHFKHIYPGIQFSLVILKCSYFLHSQSFSKAFSLVLLETILKKFSGISRMPVKIF